MEKPTNTNNNCIHTIDSGCKTHGTTEDISLKRQLDVTKELVILSDGLNIEETDRTIDATYELWFDVDQYFGTNIRDIEDTWINFYTMYHPDSNDISAIYYISSDDSNDGFEWELTPEEKIFFLKKMEQESVSHYGVALKQLWEQRNIPIEFCNIQTDKKANSRYWDDIDGKCYELIQELSKYSTTQVLDEELNNITCQCGAEIREIIINHLKNVGGNFPFVNEDL